jgi:PPM family protein phosphatase
MRGIPGSLLGWPLQKAYRLGCLDDRNELKLINVGESAGNYGCQLFAVKFLQPSDAKQVKDGLPTGSEDQAFNQMKELARKALPLCPTTSSTPRNTPKAPAPSSSAPTSSTLNQPNAPQSHGPPPGPEGAPPTDEDREGEPLPTSKEPPPQPQPPTSTSAPQSAPPPVQPNPAPQPDVDCRKAA